VVLKLLQKHFNSETIIKTADKYNPYDYIDKKNKIMIELKSRRIKKLQYPDTMIGLNKINKGFKHIDNDYKVYLCWSYTDGLAYYELCRGSYKKEWERIGGRCDRGEDERVMCSFIPTDLMIDIPC
jgi:hypothetical protein